MRPGGGGGFRSTLEGVADVKNTTVNPRAVTTVVLNNLCQSLCSSSNSDSDHNHPEICSPVCTHLCPSICYTTRITSPSSLPPAAGETKPHISSIILGVSVSLMAIAFLFFAFLAIRKVHAIWRRNRRRPETVFEPDPEDVPEGFVDHPIWYIRTVGLQPSIINGIAVVKYRKDIALIEGTDCVVCLSEFQDDEDLRLLPKCNHAFHLPCLDTWLRSHTNCPICRAGVTNSASTVEITVRTPSVVEETRVDIHGGDDEIARESDGDSMSENVKLNENMSGEDGVGAMDSKFFAGTSNSSSSE